MIILDVPYAVPEIHQIPMNPKGRRFSFSAQRQAI
jgi:hypothetical protein